MRCCFSKNKAAFFVYLEADIFEQRVVEMLRSSKKKGGFMIVYLEADIFEHSVVEMLRLSQKKAAFFVYLEACSVSDLATLQVDDDALSDIPLLALAVRDLTFGLIHFARGQGFLMASCSEPAGWHIRVDVH